MGRHARIWKYTNFVLSVILYKLRFDFVLSMRLYKFF